MVAELLNSPTSTEKCRNLHSTAHQLQAHARGKISWQIKLNVSCGDTEREQQNGNIVKKLSKEKEQTG